MQLQELWRMVIAIKQQVRNAIGVDLDYAFRSTQTYQAYTALCGEAQMACGDGELDESLVAMLQEAAEKVIVLWQRSYESGSGESVAPYQVPAG